MFGSLFSVNETGPDKQLLSPEKAVGKLQEQAAFLDLEGESSVAVTEITLEYVVVMSPDGKILVIPVWRFLLGKNEDERSFLRQKILGIVAVIAKEGNKNSNTTEESELQSYHTEGVQWYHGWF